MPWHSIFDIIGIIIQDKIDSEDTVFEATAMARVVIDEPSLKLLSSGSIVDYTVLNSRIINQ